VLQAYKKDKSNTNCPNLDLAHVIVCPLTTQNCPQTAQTWILPLSWSGQQLFIPFYIMVQLGPLYNHLVLLSTKFSSLFLHTIPKHTTKTMRGKESKERRGEREKREPQNEGQKPLHAFHNPSRHPKP